MDDGRRAEGAGAGVGIAVVLGLFFLIAAMIVVGGGMFFFVTPSGDVPIDTLSQPPRQTKAMVSVDPAQPEIEVELDGGGTEVIERAADPVAPVLAVDELGNLYLSGTIVPRADLKQRLLELCVSVVRLQAGEGVRVELESVIELLKSLEMDYVMVDEVATPKMRQHDVQP